MDVCIDLTRIISLLVRSGRGPSTLDQALPSAVLASLHAKRGQCLPARDPPRSNASLPSRSCSPYPHVPLRRRGARIAAANRAVDCVPVHRRRSCTIMKVSHMQLLQRSPGQWLCAAGAVHSTIYMRIELSLTAWPPECSGDPPCDITITVEQRAHVSRRSRVDAKKRFLAAGSRFSTASRVGLPMPMLEPTAGVADTSW